jgi:hypothetical protein
MRATKQYMLAALSKAVALPDLKGQWEYGFLHTQVKREVNRVTTALRDAARLIEHSGLPGY